MFFPIDDLIECKKLLAVQPSCPVCGIAMDIEVHPRQEKAGLALKDKSVHKHTHTKKTNDDAWILFARRL